MKICEHFEYPAKVTVTFDDMVGMECPLCQAGNRNKELLNRINDGLESADNHVRVTKEDVMQWLKSFHKDIEEGRI